MVEAVGLERNKKNYASLDVLKLIMALIVVARHIGGGQLCYCLDLLCSAHFFYYFRVPCK